jgi:hypothetical protein
MRTGAFASTIAVLIALLMFAPAVASGQVVASNFQELRFKVEPGDIVYVTDETGQERRARILDLSSSVLVLSVDGTRRDFSERAVRRLRQRLPDSLKNGALIGGAVVLTVAVLGRLTVADDGGTFWENAGFILYLGAIGAGVGTGIDAAIQTRKTIYEAPARASPGSLGMSPLVSRAVKGLRFSITF